MIAFFPEPYPDELAFSLFCRYYLYSGHLTHAAVMQELYCKRSDTISKEFIGNLNDNARTVISNVCPLGKLAMDHTMFSQYACFVPLAQKEEALRHLGWDSTDVHHLFTVLPRSDTERHLRYCPICAQEDRKIYGEAYWHRKHQIRNMTVCPQHKCLLKASEVSIKSEQTYAFSPAEVAITDTLAEYSEDSRLNEFAEYMAAVFDAPIDMAHDIPITAVLYHAMKKTEYMKSTGRSRHTSALAEDMTAFYRSMGLPSVATMSQIQNVLLASANEFSVVCQLAYFLGMSVEDLTAPVLTAEQIAAERDAHYIRNRTPVDWSEFDTETAAILDPLAQSIYDGSFREDGRPERVSERLIYRVLGLQGHRLENMPQCLGIMQRYYETYEQHWARRLVWAYNKLKMECGGEQFFWVDMRRISGVKERNLAKVVPLIYNYTDKETADDIIRIVGKSIPK